jgi:hypothetical protein
MSWFSRSRSANPKIAVRGHHDHNAGDDALVIAHGAEVDGELPNAAIPTQDGQVEVVDLVTRERGIEGISEHGSAVWRDQLGERTSDELALFVAGVVPAAVGIADEPGRIDHQDQALGVIEDFFREVAGMLQFRLEGLQAGDVEHQPAVLQNLTLHVGNRKGVDEHVDRGAILAPQYFLVIANNSVLLNEFVDVPQAVGRGV